MLRPQRVLTCGDATRLSAKSLRQNCFAPTNTPTAKTLPAFLSACPHPRWPVLNLVFIQLRCCCASQPEWGESAPLSAVLFCSAPPLGCGFHSPLWRQTANNGTSWRLICASRARSRAGARLGRASRACSPPICTILRCLIKLVWASLRLSEPRVTGFALRGHQVIYAKSPTAHIRYSLVPSQYSPSTGQALAHRSRSRKGQSPKSAVIRGLHNNMPPTTSAHNPFATNLHRVARLKLLGCVYLIDSLPAALDKLFIFSFKISVIFVKLLRHIFQILHERALKCLLAKLRIWYN